MKKYKVLFCDLDGTLIETKSGDTFPQGIWDMNLRMEVFASLFAMAPDYIHIVSNQGGIEQGFVDEHDFSDKLRYVCTSLKEFLHGKTKVDAVYCASSSKDNPSRKPNTGMLEYFSYNVTPIKKLFDKADMLMIGDASGKEGQFSDSDKKTAENFGIDYMDIEEFIKKYNSYENNQGRETPNI